MGKAALRFALAAAIATSFAASGASPASAETVSPAQEVPGTTSLTGVGCATATTCYAVGFISPGFAVMVPVIDGVAGTAQRLPGTSAALDDVDCTSATTCYAVGWHLVQIPGGRPERHAIVVPITNGVLGTPVEVPGVERLVSIDCVDGTTCYVLTDEQMVLPLVNGVAGAPQPVPGIDWAISFACASPSTCYVVGQKTGDFSSPDFEDWFDKGVVVPIVDGVVGPAQEIPAMMMATAVACATATTCYVVGTGGFDVGLQPVVVPVIDGVVGEPTVIPDANVLVAIACATATTCEAVGFNNDGIGIVVPIVDGVPGAALPVAGTNGLAGVACGSAASCVAVGNTPSGPGNPGQGVVAVINVPLTNAEDCKGGVWKHFRDPAYKNQGQCMKAARSGG
jgi:hypothetical protein